MTYFNPKVYCKQNLKDVDRKELEFYQTVFENVLLSAQDAFEIECGSASPLIDAIQEDIASEFAEILKEQLGITLQELVVGTIDSYEDVELEEVEEPETFYYQPEEEDDEEEAAKELPWV